MIAMLLLDTKGEATLWH